MTTRSMKIRRARPEDALKIIFKNTNTYLARGADLVPL